MQVFWFSNRCPYFSAKDAEEYLFKIKENIIKKEALRSLGFLRAYQWLQDYSHQWSFFLSKVQKEQELIFKANGQIIYYNSLNYPEQLKRIHFPPALLVVKGNLNILNQESVAVVGARHPTDLGRQWVQINVPELVKNNFIIVSGGARGIDFEAHTACLRARGGTIAFLPSAIHKPYPAMHTWLFKKTTDEGGLLVTEFLSVDDVRSKNFHQRNRLIAGLSRAVVIVEAAQKSGTMITAHKALHDNNDVLVVPGSPLLDNYAGSLEILSQGAALARHAKDIIEKIRGVS